MKLKGTIRCPYCGENTNTRTIAALRTHLWDDEEVKEFKSYFKEEIPITDTCDNVVYKCKCENCNKYFSALITFKNIEVDLAISSDDTFNLLHLKAPNNKQK